MPLKRLVPLLIIAVLLVWLPFIVPSQYFTTLATQILIFSIFTMGLNVLLGYMGMASLGHGALFGIGAYVPALLGKYLTQNMWLGMGSGVFVAVLFSIFFALIVTLAEEGRPSSRSAIACGPFDTAVPVWSVYSPLNVNEPFPDD